MTNSARVATQLLLALVLAVTLTAIPAGAEIKSHEGWSVVPTPHTYQALIDRVGKAAKAHAIGVVTRASATVGASKVLGQTIPGNMVIGLYHPRFAVRMLKASVAAGIEAPIRVYITENENGSATLSYKTPSSVFAPYMDEGGEALKELALELDALFAKLTHEAAGQ